MAFKLLTSNGILLKTPSGKLLKRAVAEPTAMLWSDPATWGGTLPTSADTPTIPAGQTIVYDLEDAIFAGVTIQGTLKFKTDSTCILRSTENIVVTGLMEIKPDSVSVNHSLIFTGVDESAFVGGGMSVLSTDVGLWVMDGGKIDLIGGEKTAWTRATATVLAGATTLPIGDVTGWQVGDEIMIVPTRTAPIWDGDGVDPFLAEFEVRTITNISTNTITLNSALTYNHEKVETEAMADFADYGMTSSTKVWYPEVANLTRNVRIEGTESGKAHIFVHDMGMSGTNPHFVKHVAFRHLGPRKPAGDLSRSSKVAGRYALHFHHCGDRTIGTEVVGCCMRDIATHCYVPHGSTGIKMYDNVSFNTLEVSFWWDYGHFTHSADWQRNLVAFNSYIPGSLDTTGTEGSVHFTGGGIYLGMGDDCIAKDNCVVYGGIGDVHTQGAYIWEANNEGIWVFENNMAHSNPIALRVWQNTVRNHTIIGLDFYNNYQNIFHGAYANAYTYRYCYFHKGINEVKASPANSSGVRFEYSVFDSANIQDHSVIIVRSPVEVPLDTITFIRCAFKDFNISPLLSETDPEYKKVDLIECDLGGVDPTFIPLANAESLFRIQPVTGQSRLLKNGSTQNIADFAPKVWGTGLGLKGDYYHGTNFNTLIFTRTDSVIMFSEWAGDAVIYNLPVGVHHKITQYDFSVRWTGFIQSQRTEDHTFWVAAPGGVRLWINDVLIIDDWTEAFNKYISSTPVAMLAGEFYSIKMEYFNEGSGAVGAMLYWNTPSMLDLEGDPYTQLVLESQCYRELPI